MTLTRVRSWFFPALVLGTALALIALTMIVGWSPTIPADAGSTVVARATLRDSGSGDGQCLDRIEHPSGSLDLCWDVTQEVDGDAAKDYFTLRVYGTVSGGGTGIRWWAVRGTLVGAWGQPADGVFETWPNGTYEGACTEEFVAIPVTIGATETICGRTTGKFISGWGHQVTWNCVGCLLPDHATRSIALYVSVGVVQGDVPSWDIGADFGD